MITSPMKRITKNLSLVFFVIWNVLILYSVYGTFSDGMLSNGAFRDGMFSEGTFNDGMFSDGMLSDRMFSDGMFSDGTFNDGMFCMRTFLCVGELATLLKKCIFIFHFFKDSVTYLLS